MQVVLHTHLEVSPDVVWSWLQRPLTLVDVTKPLMAFDPIDPSVWPERWAQQDYVCSLRLYGAIPLGEQVIAISFPPPEGGKRFIRDNGHSKRIKRWDHVITVEPEGTGTRYEDRLQLDAGALTPAVAVFAKLFYRHRQSRWRKLAKQINDGDASL